MRIVARRRISGLIEPLMIAGTPIAVAVSLPWFTRPIHWYVILVGMLLVFFGAFWVVFAVKGWWPRGIGLVFTPQGITWRSPIGPPFRSWMISLGWDDVLRAHYVTRKEVRFAGTGSVILELRPDARSWPNAKWAKKASETLQKQLGRSLSDNVVGLIDPWWDWRPEDVAASINESVDDPQSRARWGSADAETAAEPADRF